MARPPTPLRHRVFPKIRSEINGCWTWTGTFNSKGYGVVYDNAVKNQRRAHRIVYELVHGPIPDGLTLDHLCRNRLCVNPAHLEPVTRGENVLRGVGPSAQNADKTHCKHGHVFTESNTYRWRGNRQCRTCNRLRAREYAAADRKVLGG